MKTLRLFVLVGVFVPLLSIPAVAQDSWDEGLAGSDAGDSPATAQDASEINLRAIYGWLDPADDVDMYKIRIVDPPQFGATTEKQKGTHPDTRLFVFDEDGFGIYYNDDSPHSTDSLSTLPVGDSLAPSETGIYYIAVSMYEVVALDEDGVHIFEDPRDFGPSWHRINGPVSAKPLAEWITLGSSGVTGSYTITLGGTGGPPLNVAAEDVELPNALDVTVPYPNPFSSTSVIEVRVERAQYVEASLFDILGRKVRALHGGFESADNPRRIEISADGLPSGTYFVRVQGDDFVTARMVTVAK
jgi:hypothetical protein